MHFTVCSAVCSAAGMMEPDRATRPKLVNSTVYKKHTVQEKGGDTITLYSPKCSSGECSSVECSLGLASVEPA